ncbi:homeobox protein [Anaeramoeba flamelloides]|uniref:Homeobox protein n=1 Tax=Anaeramoeba flamelloides TaxID=1746091 RepID=A0AAV8AHU2_9EUKA|nr:homeobox protein [Anaeramoeba flamelloides]
MSIKLFQDYNFYTQKEGELIFDKFRFESLEEEYFEEDLALQNEIHSKYYNVSLYNKQCLDLKLDQLFQKKIFKKSNNINEIIYDDFNFQIFNNDIESDCTNSFEDILIKPIFNDFLEQQFLPDQQTKNNYGLGKITKQKQSSNNFFESSAKELFYYSSPSSSYSNPLILNLNSSSSNSEGAFQDKCLLGTKIQTKKTAAKLEISKRKNSNGTNKNNNSSKLKSNIYSTGLCDKKNQNQNEIETFSRKKEQTRDEKKLLKLIGNLVLKATSKKEIDFLTSFQRSYLEEKKKIEVDNQKWIQIYQNKVVQNQFRNKGVSNVDLLKIKKYFKSLSQALDKIFLKQLNQYTQISHTPKKRKRLYNQVDNNNQDISNLENTKIKKLSKLSKKPTDNILGCDNKDLFLSKNNNKINNNLLNFNQKNEKVTKNEKMSIKGQKPHQIKRKSTTNKYKQGNGKKTNRITKNHKKACLKQSHNNNLKIINSNENDLLSKKGLKSSKQISYIKRKRLNPIGKEMLNNWIQDRILSNSGPYATLEEKIKLSKETKISCKQITSYLGNARNKIKRLVKRGEIIKPVWLDIQDLI